MDIRQRTSQETLLDVFRNGRRRAGDSIAELELVAAWARIGLKWGDLQMALYDLTHRGLLAMRTYDGHQRVVLTRAGCRAIEPRPGEWFLRLINRCRLQWLRLTAATPAEPAPSQGSLLMVVVATVAVVLILPALTS